MRRGSCGRRNDKEGVRSTRGRKHVDGVENKDRSWEKETVRDPVETVKGY